jgi:hypothetical protein
VLAPGMVCRVLWPGSPIDRATCVVIGPAHVAGLDRLGPLYAVRCGPCDPIVLRADQLVLISTPTSKQLELL